MDSSQPRVCAQVDPSLKKKKTVLFITTNPEIEALADCVLTCEGINVTSDNAAMKWYDQTDYEKLEAETGTTVFARRDAAGQHALFI